MIEQIFRSQRVVRRLQKTLLGSSFEALVVHLKERGHSVGTIQSYVQSVEHFDTWLRRTHRPISCVDEIAVGTFLRKHLPRCRCPPPCSRTVHQVRTSLRHLLTVLRCTGRAKPRRLKTSAAEKLVREFSDHLRDVGGLADATCSGRSRFARAFLADRFGDGPISFSQIDRRSIEDFFATRSWSRGTMQVGTTSLRSFFRYLQLVGRVKPQVVHALPRVANWPLATVPRVLTDEQVARLLASFDRSTSVGLREYATTMCLARLGMRACEVAALKLEDIDWRRGTLTIPATKTRRTDVMPLPAVVGRAILEYLQRGRPVSNTRQIFIRHATPSGTAGPGIVRAAVRKAGARIGLADHEIGPNILRHTVATRLLRSGATMKDIADLLRHRSIDTTAIYAKVDLNSLREVAACWPGGEQ